MKKKVITVAVMMSVLLMACQNVDSSLSQNAVLDDSVSTGEIIDNEEASDASASDNDASDTSGMVAQAAPEAAVEIDYDSLNPVYADSINDGTYDVQVDCSSSMFVIDSCQVTKEGDTLIATLTMGGKGYLYVYAGTGEEAAEASPDDYIYFTENEDGNHVYTFEIEGFDIPMNLAAFSKNKELWYDRILVFKASSLGVDAYADGEINTVDSLGLEDGEYLVEVSLSGGSGRASVESPASIKIENGEAYATIIWSSSNYDYMKVGEETYYPVNTEGNSTYIIPVSCFDYGMAVKADTTAMSEPHEIDYVLTFDSSSIK